MVAFFQRRPPTSFADVPDSGDRRERFSAELHTMTFEQQNHLWGALGAKYMPSVMYKVGVIDIDDSQIEALVPPVEDFGVSAAL